MRGEGDTYLELPTQELAKVLGLDPQDVLVYFPLFLAAGDGQVGEEAIRKEAVAKSVIGQIFKEFRILFTYSLILTMASLDILSHLLQRVLAGDLAEVLARALR